MFRSSPRGRCLAGATLALALAALTVLAGCYDQADFTQPTDPCWPVLVGGELVESLPERYFVPRPEYPLEAVLAGHEGSVILLATVGSLGRVCEVSVSTSSGYPELDQEAARCARAALYIPAISRFGHPCATVVDFKVTFRILSTSDGTAAYRAAVPPDLP